MVQRLSADDLKKVCPPRMTACSVPLQTNGVVARERESDGVDRRYLAAVGPLRSEIHISGTAQQKFFFAKACRNWQAHAAYSAGATKPPSPLTRRS
jgi:hypothetical protein